MSTETEPDEPSGTGIALKEGDSFFTGSNSVWVRGGSYNHSVLLIS